MLRTSSKLSKAFNDCPQTRHHCRPSPGGEGDESVRSAAGQVGDAASGQVALLQKFLARNANSAVAGVVAWELEKRSVKHFDAHQPGTIDLLNDLKFSRVICWMGVWLAVWLWG